MSRNNSKNHTHFLSLIMAAVVFAFPILARAACPCPEGATPEIHAKMHSQEASNSHDSKTSTKKPCHGDQHSDSKQAPSHSQHSDGQKSKHNCCSISAADFDLVKVDVTLNSIKPHLEKKFFSAVTFCKSIFNFLSVNYGGFQRYGPSPNQFVETIPLYTQYQSFLI